MTYRGKRTLPTSLVTQATDEVKSLRGDVALDNILLGLDPIQIAVMSANDPTFNRITGATAAVRSTRARPDTWAIGSVIASGSWLSKRLGG
jgi:hypothetical protein